VPSRKIIDLHWIKVKIRSDYFMLFVMAACYVSIVSSLAISGHYAFNTNAWDLGIYSQAFYTTLNHQKFFYYTSELPGNPSGSLFGIHFSPFLFLLLPVYAVCQNPITLLVLRPIAIAIGLIPLYWMAREELNSRLIIFSLAIIYLVYPPVLIPILSFDVEVFLPALFLFALHYFKKGRLFRAFLFILLALMVNEFVPLIVVAMAIYFLILSRKNILEGLRRRRLTRKASFSIVLLLTSILWFSLASMVIASFNPTALSTKWEWREFGTGPYEIVVNVLTNPMKTANVFFSDGQRKFVYVVSLLAPLGFSSLLHPLPLVMALPWLAASLLSINPLYYNVVTQYPAFVSASIFVSAIYGLRKLLNGTDLAAARRVVSFVIFSLLITTMLLPTGDYLSVTETDEYTRMALNEIPADASVSVMPEVYPHLCNRLEVYPYFKSGVDYVLINVYSWWYTATFPQPAHTAPRWCDAEIDERYGIVVNAKGVLLFKEDYKDGAKYFEGVNFTYTSGDVRSATGKVVKDPADSSSSSTKEDVLVHEVTDPTPLFFEVPDMILPPGRYNVRVVLMISSISSNDILTLEIVKAQEHSRLITKEISAEDFVLPGTWQAFEVDFTIRRPIIVEMATYVTKSTDIYFYSMNVLQASGDV
jgi:uncharacterized membrane protein